ncbi:peptidoglycan editing factor PgeF [Corynebacterium macginleyi]|uniref:peptidoglycan editing factor PgeF n=1 Tax=Corynebacterium macginleyi TaxID=38290 RepID=UPI00190C9280|nr:peptidoglycan editing factor PgeF [Corynebacterium macginleyi]QRJ58593.1 peptidoglycan editing factor PgeF [Corynebacterium macginleyi]
MSVNEEHRTNRPVRMVFTSRAGGASAYPYESFNLGSHVGDNPANVGANRERLLRITGIENIVWMEQLHTNTVTVVDGPRDTPVPATDAILTTQRRLGLGVLVADCTPVLLVDVSAGVIAAVHAGRLGARNAIVVNTVREMQKLGAQPERIQVVMGPAASGKNYEVPEEMANDVERRLPGSKCKTAQGTWGIDVRAGLIRQLMGLGITNIDSDPRCTIEDTNFFSYRREGTTGRQAGVIWLEANHE